MKRVIVTGAGGPAGRNFVRSLREAPEPFYIVGTDVNEYYLQLAPVEARYVVPHCTAPGYIDVLNNIIEAEEIELVHPQPDPEVGVISENREVINARTHLPAKKTVRTCQDKLAAVRAWEEDGLRKDRAMVIEEPGDLGAAAEMVGLPLWLRADSGAGRRGATPVHSLEMGLHWIGYWRAQGVEWSFMAEKFLPGRDLAFASLWHEGELIASLSLERLEYMLPNQLPTQKTGPHTVGVSRHNDTVNRTATACIRAVSPCPHGVFCVDLREDADGNPVPTEINCGRFYASSLFYVNAGANLPYYYVKRAFGESADTPFSSYNAIPADIFWLRHVDTDSVMIPRKDLEYTSCVDAPGVQ
jgi:carbamoyl-phosphate synthase large subunit